MTRPSSVYDLSFVNNRGETVELSQFAGRPLLIVNTASKCGLTPHYEGLESIHQRFAPKGLVVLGFPCDQFAHQEPGSDEEIAEFCQLNYGVTFPLSTKVAVNGNGTHPIFKFLKGKTGGVLGGVIKWNFTKFLVAPDGTITRYAPTTLPADIEPDIEALLGAE